MPEGPPPAISRALPIMIESLGTPMAQAVASMTLILLTWVVVAACCLGWGRLAVAGIGLKVRGMGGLWDTFWLGWGILILALQILHLGTRVGGGFGVAAAAVGNLGWWVRAGADRPRLNLPRLGRIGWLVAAAAAGVWLANRSLGSIISYDAGLYHLSAIRWAADYAIVPGLANLHSRLAMLSPYFLYLSALTGAGWGKFGAQIGAGLLLWVSLAGGLYSFWRLVTRRDGLHATDVFRALFLLPLVRLGFPYAFGPSPDLPVFLFGFAAAVGLCRILEARLPVEEARSLLLATALLAVFGVTLKLSYGPLGVGTLAVLALIALRRRLILDARQRPAKEARAAASVALLIVGVWLARNVVLSGFPLYPLTFLGVRTSWAIPEEQVRSDATWIASWARKPKDLPEQVLGNWDWLGFWWRNVVLIENRRFDVVYPLVLAVGGVSLRFLTRGVPAGVRISPLFLLPGGVAAAAWFALAPEPRLAGAGLWWLGIGALTAGVLPALRTRAPAGRVLMVGLVAAIVATHWAEEKLVNPGPVHGFHPMHAVKLDVVQTDSGLELYVPRVGDRCWYAALPCTPNPDPALALIRPGDLGSGFVR